MNTDSSREYLVCLTFDFDTISPRTATGRTSPGELSRGEFGLLGAERVLALLARYELLSTWFIPGVTIDTYPEACASVAEAGHEIGHHGYDHVSPTDLDREDEAEQLNRGSESISKLTGRRPRGYRAPGWELSEHSVDLLLEQAFVYDSSLMAHDYMPYRARRGDRIEPGKPVRFGEESPLLELPISWSLDDYPHFELREGDDAAAVPGEAARSALTECRRTSSIHGSWYRNGLKP